MPNKLTTKSLIESLIGLKHLFSPSANARKLEILKELSIRAIPGPRDLVNYHDILCFMQACPANALLLRMVDGEFDDFSHRIAHFREVNGPEDDRINDFGMVNTVIRYPYNYLMARWLVGNYGADVDIDWDDYNTKEEDPLSGLLSIFALHAENDGVDDEDLSTEDWINEARDPSQTSLAWLLGKIDSLDASSSIKQNIYDSAEIGLCWNLGESAAARTLARKKSGEIFFQRRDLKKSSLDLRKSHRKARPALELLKGRQGAAVLDRLVAALLPRHRELYPVLYGNPSEVYRTSPGRGIKIYIAGMRPDDRMPLEANYSALLVKNGVPIGYGIAVLFFERCEIAINVFDTFRSGEASVIFDHFLRVFYHHFGGRAFLMRRWQVGHENDEGLQSGSFWFYYKLGFRPISKDVADLATEEMRKIMHDRSYRTDIRTLKKLALSDLLVDFRPKPKGPFSELKVSDIGIALTRYIAFEFRGDSAKASRDLRRKVADALGMKDLHRWSRSEKLHLGRWSPLLGLIPDLGSWSRREKSDLIRIIRSRADIREIDYVRLLQRHGRLQKAFIQIAASGSHQQ